MKLRFGIVILVVMAVLLLAACELPGAALVGNYEAPREWVCVTLGDGEQIEFFGYCYVSVNDGAIRCHNLDYDDSYPGELLLTSTDATYRPGLCPVGQALDGP
jgi:hypothetical protein